MSQSKQDRVKLAIAILITVMIITLVVYNSIVYGMPKYPYDGM